MSLKVKLENKMVVVENPPHGVISLSTDYLTGLKKDEFEKMHKGKIDINSVWKAIKPYTAEKKKGKETK